MFTNAPHHALVANSTSSEDARTRGSVAWLLGWVQQSLCALHGHDAILQFERNRIFLRCTSCGHETPGWEVAANSEMVRHRPLERPALAARGDLAVARKIA